MFIEQGGSFPFSYLLSRSLVLLTLGANHQAQLLFRWFNFGPGSLEPFSFGGGRGAVLCCVVWCGLVWCVVLCGGVWCGVVWCGVPKTLLSIGNGRDALHTGNAKREGCVSERVMCTVCIVWCTYSRGPSLSPVLGNFYPGPPCRYACWCN